MILLNAPGETGSISNSSTASPFQLMREAGYDAVLANPSDLSANQTGAVGAPLVLSNYNPGLFGAHAIETFRIINKGNIKVGILGAASGVAGFAATLSEVSRLATLLKKNEAVILWYACLPSAIRTATMLMTFILQRTP